MKSIPVRLFTVSVALGVAWAAQAAADQGPRSVWKTEVRGGFQYGPAEGFLQTPAGGEPGTASHRRPALDELGIGEAVFYDLLAAVQWRQLLLYGGYQPIVLTGHARLSETLISRSLVFPAGTPVRAETDLNWIRVGAGWVLEFLQQRGELVPKTELAWLDFNYQLAGGGQATDRSYLKGAWRLGLETRYRFNRVVSVWLDAGASVPLSDTPQIAAIMGGIQLDLAAGHGRIQPRLILGGGAQRIEYEDDQDLPNHFRVDVRPCITVGLAISF